MSIFSDLVAGIASQLDGVVSHREARDDMAWIDLANERAGLRVVIRVGMGAERTRIRATMSLQAMNRGDVQFNELPAVHDLETAAAMSRGADVIARQIEAKLVQPAMPMLERAAEIIAARAADKAAHAAAIARYRVALGDWLRIDDKGGFYASLPSGGYVRGDVNSDGGLYIDRASRIPEGAALDLLAKLIGG